MSLNFESVHAARHRAQAALPRVVFDFIDGGADDEWTARANCTAYSSLTLLPRATLGVIKPRLATSVVGQPIAFPVLTAPCGFVRVAHPDGESGVARAAASAGTVSVLSSMAGTALEDVASGVTPPGLAWFQLYHLGGRKWADRLVDRADAAGYGALVVTIDTAVGGNRERDTRNRVPQPLAITPRTVCRHGPGMLAHPRWLVRFCRDGMPLGFPNAPRFDDLGAPMTQTDAQAMMAKEPPTWEDLSRIRDRWPRPLLVKGVMGSEDARRFVDLGADGIIVSNHGGRQLDCVRPTLHALPEVVEAVSGRADVLVDGGVRRGTDVIKALALGARAVLIGRPFIWALACAGEAGVQHLLKLLRTEMTRDLILLGCRDVQELDESWLGASAPAGHRVDGRQLA